MTNVVQISIFQNQSTTTGEQPLFSMNPDKPQYKLPSTPPTVVAIQKMDPDPEEFLSSLIPYVSERILGEWINERQNAKSPVARSNTIRRYETTAAAMERRYANENGITVSELNPIETVRSLFTQSSFISDAAYNLYRHSLLYIYSQRQQNYTNQGNRQETLTTALAMLIVFSRRPYGRHEKGDVVGKPKAKNKTLQARFFVDLVTHLAVGYPARNKLCRMAQSAAIATLTTGMRPGEWVDAVLREPTPEEMPNGLSPKGWLAVVVQTSKRKDYEDVWVRTLLIEPGSNQAHIQQHYRFLMESIAKRPKALDPGLYHNRHCSSAIIKACKELWPQYPNRWVTLTSLRSQANANFTAVHGPYVAAGMMGHSPAKGRYHYAGASRSNLPRGVARKAGGPVPFPGPDCMAKAAEFEQHMNDIRSAAESVLLPSSALEQPNS